jgi:twinkle protein
VTERGESRVVGKEACPECGSRDNLARYDDGHAYCFGMGCGYYEPGSGEAPTPRRSTLTSDMLRGEPRDLAKRGIRQTTCEKFGYWVGQDAKGNTVQIANYRPNGQTIAQKVRGKDKKFFVTGDGSKMGLWGKHLWKEGGRRLVITEGEIDALSYAQVTGLTWPVVSLPKGASGAAAAIREDIEFCNSFEQVVLMFDMDEAGRKAVEACVDLFPPGKCAVAELPLKDANEMLVADRVKELTTAAWQAKVYRPDGIVDIRTLRDEVLADVAIGAPWPWEALTKATFGRRPGEVYALGAGTGVGKTDVFTQIICKDVIELKIPCGVLYLEQPVVETVKRVAGKMVGKRFHVPDGSWTKAELTEAFDKLADTGLFHPYDAFGAMDWDVIKARIEYLIVGLGCKHIFLDHLTALAAGQDDERVALEAIMADIAMLAQRHKVVFHFISHLATPDGKPHEEGGRVTIRHFKGSRAIGYWSHFMFGLERDQQAEDPEERSQTTFRILKDRYTGQATGQVILLAYDAATGLLSEAVATTGGGFKDESKAGADDDDAPF